MEKSARAYFKIVADFAVEGGNSPLSGFSLAIKVLSQEIKPRAKERHEHKLSCGYLTEPFRNKQSIKKVNPRKAISIMEIEIR